MVTCSSLFNPLVLWHVTTKGPLSSLPIKNNSCSMEPLWCSYLQVKYSPALVDMRACLFLQAPAINGPATGTCGPVPIQYGTSGAGMAKVQTFVAPAPLFIPQCSPAATDTYVYSLGVGRQSNYILPGPGASQLTICIAKRQVTWKHVHMTGSSFSRVKLAGLATITLHLQPSPLLVCDVSADSKAHCFFMSTKAAWIQVLQFIASCP